MIPPQVNETFRKWIMFISKTIAASSIVHNLNLFRIFFIFYVDDLKRLTLLHVGSGFICDDSQGNPCD